MSMILDALKKADAERRLGELPGLHSRSVPGLALSQPVRRWQRRSCWLVLAGAPVLLILLMLLVWWLGRPDAPAALVARSRPIVAPASGPVSVSVPAPVHVPSPVPVPVLEPAPAPASLAPVGQVAADIAVPPPLPRPVPKPRREPALPPAPVATAAASLPAPAPAPASPMLTLATLPPNLQRELPSLVIGGSMYSDNPADRMLLIDKRLLREGDEVAPGLVLESLMPKAAILRFKGVRFQLGY